MPDSGKDRYRVNVSRTATGKYTWDCTVEHLVEAEDYDSIGHLLSESDRLVSELQSRYPDPAPTMKGD